MGDYGKPIIEVIDASWELYIMVVVAAKGISHGAWDGQRVG